MASLSWPNPEGLSRCFTFVRWLHANGSSWSGTAAELTAQLRLDSDATLWFSDSDDVVAFLESNEDTLRQLGLESSIRRIPGRPRLIELHLTEPGTDVPSRPVEVASPPSDLVKSLEEPEMAQPTVEEKWESLLPPE